MVLLTEVSWGAAALADRNEAPSDLPLRQRARPPSSQAPSRPAPQSARFHSEGHRNAINMDDLAARTDPVRRRRLRERDEVFVRPVTARETVSHVPLAPARWNGTGRQAFVTPIALEPIEKTLTPWATARAHAAAALELSRARARMAQEQRAQEVKELRADCFAKAQALIKRYTDPSSVTEGLIDDASPLGAIPSAVQQDAPPTEPNAGPAAAAPAAGMVDVASLLPSLHAARASRRRGGGGSESSKGKKSRGPYASAPLRIEALPAWKTEWPAKVGSAADRFDRAHQRRWDHAEGLILALSGDTTHLAKQEALHDVTIEIFRGRYAEPVELTGIRRYERRSAKVKPPAAKRAWKLEDSIWKPRVKWADSKGFWDSDDVERSMFECDWARAISCGLSKTIYRMDDGGNADAGSDEVTEVMDVLWEYHDLLFVIFDYYAAIGANTDVTTVSSNSFAEFATECRLVDKRSKACKIADFDRLYISVDATGGKATDERFNRKKALNRQEFVQCVVKTACMRYIESGELDDVSDAVHRLFRADLEPRLNPLIFVEPNVFRTEYAPRQPQPSPSPFKAMRSAFAGLRAGSRSLLAHHPSYRISGTRTLRKWTGRFVNTKRLYDSSMSACASTMELLLQKASPISSSTSRAGVTFASCLNSSTRT